MPVGYTRFPERRKVALLVQTASGWSREVLKGVAEFALEQGGWDVLIEPRGFREQLRIPSWWRGHGVILRLTNPGLARAIRRRRIPAVNVSWLARHTSTNCKVVSDERKCGMMAAEHYLERGFRHAAFVGPWPDLRYSNETEWAYRDMLQQHGVSCDTFPHESRKRSPEKLFRGTLTNWLRTLPKPVGVLVWNGEFGREVTTACANSHLDIPDEVAVVCVEHDSLMSSLAPVPLSTIDQDGIGVGFAAGEVLERMMQGEPPPAEPTLVPPVRIITRQSSDTIAADDPIVSAGVRFIRDHANQPIQVIDVLKHLNVSRRVLEHRFVSIVGRTPAAEIRKVKLNRVKELLLGTKLSLEEIAVRCGYNHLEVMVRSFQRETGTTPGRFRRRQRD